MKKARQLKARNEVNNFKESLSFFKKRFKACCPFKPNYIHAMPDKNSSQI
jgi:hypothetical protein